MLLGFLKNLFGKGGWGYARRQAHREINSLYNKASRFQEVGHLKDAINTFRQILELDPYHLEALNQIAVCLMNVQRDDEAIQYFERATLIDDSFAPALINIATRLATHYQTGKAEKYLRRAQELVPDNPYVDVGLSSIYGMRGRAEEANFHQIQAWLKEFNNLSFANNYLFYHGYSSDNCALTVTAEHLFWAETLEEKHFHPLPEISALPSDCITDRVENKIRIGYLSADFRRHSVRFFFRPLLENHDRNRFKVFAYYDMVGEDDQTQLIRNNCDEFRTIANLPDAEVCQIIRNDKLDILVELTGHTSITRLHLLCNRLAHIQMTAIGYPPTTGLTSIDYKVVDQVTVPLGSEYFYAERPLRLPDSFWCFNPLEKTPDPAPPPYLKKGHITFGCFGNILKISRRILNNWVHIMKEVPQSRLIIKALAFQDEDARESVKQWLGMAGIDQERVQLDLPDPPENLYNAYAAVDIILDTYPYNGGTTSCFALWMGVPVVTLAGQDLVSRMGASMLHVLELEDLVSINDDEYVTSVVRLANDRPRLEKLRYTLRKRMLDTPLGNGLLYARQFEDACITALKEADIRQEKSKLSTPPPALPEREIIRRAETVLRTGQIDAATKILNYCFHHYPDSVGACILRGSIFELEGKLEEARAYLNEIHEKLLPSDNKQAIAVNLLRLDLMLENYALVESRAVNLMADNLDSLGKLNVNLYQLAAQAWSKPDPQHSICNGNELSLVSIVVFCNNDARFVEMQKNLVEVMSFGNYEVIRLQGDSRINEYENAIAKCKYDIILFIREEVEILSPAFHCELTKAMLTFSIVGYAGAEKIVGTRWFDAGFPYAHGAVVLPIYGINNIYNLNIYGPSRQRFCNEIKILDGALFAAKKSVFDHVMFDNDLDGEHGLCELEWSYRAFKANFRLGVAPLLGVLRHNVEDRHGFNWFDCAKYFRELHDLPDTSYEEPVAGTSILLKSTNLAWPVLHKYYAESN